MEVVDLLNNDTLSQFYKGYHVKDEIKKERLNKVCNCNHLFVLTDDTYVSPTIECVYCALSNRTLNFYLEFLNAFKKSGYQLPDEYLKKIPFEAELFILNYPDTYLNGQVNIDLNKLNLLSNKIINTYHANVLYHAACDIVNTNNKELIFKAMEELNSLESDLEKIKLSKPEESYSLTRKYKNPKI